MQWNVWTFLFLHCLVNNDTSIRWAWVQVLDHKRQPLSGVPLRLSQATDLRTQSIQQNRHGRAESNHRTQHHGKEPWQTPNVWHAVSARSGVKYSSIRVPHLCQMAPTDLWYQTHENQQPGQSKSMVFKKLTHNEKVPTSWKIVHISWITIFKKALTNLFKLLLWPSLFDIAPRVLVCKLPPEHRGQGKTEERGGALPISRWQA